MASPAAADAAIAAAARRIDAVNEAVGRAASWLVFACVVLCAATALLRYVFSIGFIWMQETYVAAFGLTFMLMAGYTYLKDQHVRVDIVHGRLSPRARARVEIAGVLVFLFPWLATLAVAGAPFILGSWRILEPSSTPGGLPVVFLVKTVIWVFCALLGLQGVSVLLRAILVLRGRGVPG